MKKLFFLITSILCIVLQAKVSMSNQNKICLKPESGDSTFFATSIAINDEYLAVSDPGANRVVIYRRNRLNQWRRERYILPPPNSVPFEVGKGFGQELELDNNVLTISTLTLQGTKDITNSEYFQNNRIFNSTFFGRYLTRIDRETELRQIGLKAEKGLGCVHFNLLSEGKIKSVTLSDREEPGFGVSSALYENLLLVGSPSHRTGGGAWLFNLENNGSDPEKISDSSLSLGETVAISKNFVVVGNFGEIGASHYWGYVEPIQPLPLPPNTLIKSLNNGSVRIIKSRGSLSLNNNLLAIKSPEHDKSDLSVLLQVLRLNDNAAPCLILQREDLENAWVQNDYLITVERHEDRTVPKVCIETIS